MIVGLLIAGSAWRAIVALIVTIIAFNTPGISNQLLERAAATFLADVAITFFLICLFQKIGVDKRTLKAPPILQHH
jgi:hypothetical protein